MARYNRSRSIWWPGGGDYDVSQANKRSLVALCYALYTMGLIGDWSHWVAICLRMAQGDYFATIATLIFGWIPAIFWPIHVLAVAWNSDYCALVFGVMCQRIFGY